MLKDLEPTPIDPGGGGFIPGGGSFAGGGGSGDIGGYNWTPGGGWTQLTFSQALQNGINYNNRHNSWAHTTIGEVNTGSEYSAGPFKFNAEGSTFGGNYHTQNGKVTSVAVNRLEASTNGAWKAVSETSIQVFAQPEFLEFFKGRINIADLKPEDLGGSDPSLTHAVSGVIATFGLGTDIRLMELSNWGKSVPIAQKGSYLAVESAGKRLGALGVAFSAYQIYNGGVNMSNGLDLAMSAVAFVPVFGWAVSGTYFIGNLIYQGATGETLGEWAQRGLAGGTGKESWKPWK